MITKRMLHGSFGFDESRGGRMGYFANYCPHCETKVFLDFNETEKFAKRASCMKDKNLTDHLVSWIPYNLRTKIVKSMIVDN